MTAAVISSYFRAKRMLAFGIMAFVLVGIAGIELGWATNYVKTQGTIVGLDQTCAQGGRGPMRWGDCSEAPPQANRRTVIALTYISPADKQQHQASVRCDTAVDNTPIWVIGQNIDLLAHKKEPGTIDRRRCTPVETPHSA